MSRSPTQQASADQAADYLDAFRTVYDLVAQGRSWSGGERHGVFLNTGGTRFSNISGTSGLDFMDDGRGVAYVDWDHDGDVDLWMSNRSGPQLRFLRNDTSRENHFLAVRLEGRTCNRDAIGARAELVLRSAAPSNQNSKLKTQKFVKTLHAGHGYLAQSSKWLHFGLGVQGEVDRVDVRWPGGTEETFRGLQAGDRYTLVEGSGVAEPWLPPKRAVELTVSTLVSDPVTVRGRIVLTVPPRIPQLSYHDMVGNGISLRQRVTGPTLLNLWASWCVPCHGELRELAQNEKRLRDAGLQIIALSVDGVDGMDGAADARMFLDTLKWGFDRGVANPQLLAKLQLLHDELFYRRMQLAVPTSFLIDRHHRIVAIYRGPVAVDRLLDDVRQIHNSPSNRSTLEKSFSGRWLERPWPNWQKMAMRFEEAGFLDDAIIYLRDALQRQPQDVNLHVALGTRLQRQDKPDEVLNLYREAVRVNPNSAEAHYHLGVALGSQSQIKQSIAQFRQALRVQPNHAPAHLHLGMALASQGRFADAERHYRQALAIQHDNDRAHFQLSIALFSQREFDTALSHLREAINLNPDLPEALNMMASILATHADPSIRRPQEAIRLGQRAAELTNHQDPLILGTLSAAYASAGQFDQAAALAETALELASSTEKHRLVLQLRQQIQSYRQAIRKQEVSPEIAP